MPNYGYKSGFCPKYTYAVCAHAEIQIIVGTVYGNSDCVLGQCMGLVTVFWYIQYQLDTLKSMSIRYIRHFNISTNN